MSIIPVTKQNISVTDGIGLPMTYFGALSADFSLGIIEKLKSTNGVYSLFSLEYLFDGDGQPPYYQAPVFNVNVKLEAERIREIIEKQGRTEKETERIVERIIEMRIVKDTSAPAKPAAVKAAGDEEKSEAKKADSPGRAQKNIFNSSIHSVFSPADKYNYYFSSADNRAYRFFAPTIIAQKNAAAPAANGEIKELYSHLRQSDASAPRLPAAKHIGVTSAKEMSFAQSLKYVQDNALTFGAPLNENLNVHEADSLNKEERLSAARRGLPTAQRIEDYFGADLEYMQQGESTNAGGASADRVEAAAVKAAADIASQRLATALSDIAGQAKSKPAAAEKRAEKETAITSHGAAPIQATASQPAAGQTEIIYKEENRPMDNPYNEKTAVADFSDKKSFWSRLTDRLRASSRSSKEQGAGGADLADVHMNRSVQKKAALKDESANGGSAKSDAQAQRSVSYAEELTAASNEEYPAQAVSHAYEAASPGVVPVELVYSEAADATQKPSVQKSAEQGSRIARESKSEPANIQSDAAYLQSAFKNNARETLRAKASQPSHAGEARPPLSAGGSREEEKKLNAMRDASARLSAEKSEYDAKRETGQADRLNFSAPQGSAKINTAARDITIGAILAAEGMPAAYELRQDEAQPVYLQGVSEPENTAGGAAADKSGRASAKKTAGISKADKTDVRAETAQAQRKISSMPGHTAAAEKAPKAEGAFSALTSPIKTARLDCDIRSSAGRRASHAGGADDFLFTDINELKADASAGEGGYLTSSDPIQAAASEEELIYPTASAAESDARSDYTAVREAHTPRHGQARDAQGAANKSTAVTEAKMLEVAQVLGKLNSSQGAMSVLRQAGLLNQAQPEAGNAANEYAVSPAETFFPETERQLSEEKHPRADAPSTPFGSKLTDKAVQAALRMVEEGFVPADTRAYAEDLRGQTATAPEELVYTEALRGSEELSALRQPFAAHTNVAQISSPMRTANLQRNISAVKPMYPEAETFLNISPLHGQQEQKGSHTVAAQPSAPAAEAALAGEAAKKRSEGKTAVQDTVVWTAPMAQPAMVHKEKQTANEEANHPPQQMSEAEIRRTADKVYRIIEERLKVERRRMGL